MRQPNTKLRLAIALFVLSILSTSCFAQLGAYTLNITPNMLPNSTAAMSVGTVVSFQVMVQHPNYLACDSWANALLIEPATGYDPASINYVMSPTSWIDPSIALDMPAGSIGWAYDDLSNQMPWSSWGAPSSGPFIFMFEFTISDMSDLTQLYVDLYFYGDFDTGAYAFGSCGVAATPDGPHPISPHVALPIELLSFNGTPLAEGNELRWVTASETNNSHFIVERSVDGVAYESLATVPGAGTTSSPTHYKFLDQDAPGGVSYYRLLQVDLNGDAEYHDVVAITRTFTPDAPIATLNMLGQVVQDDFSGPVLEVLPDGSKILRGH